MQLINQFYERLAERKLIEALDDSPVVLIFGPRQCGKTTLTQLVCAPAYLNDVNTRPASQTASIKGTPMSPSRDYSYFSFDDAALRASATEDPVGFVLDLPERVILDEIQKVPELFNLIKQAVDRDRVAGRFVLTGSSNVSLVPELATALVGRLEVIELHPLAQIEIVRKTTSGQDTPTFLDALFAGRFKASSSPRLGSRLIDLVLAGGYPPALIRSNHRRQKIWYRNYVNTLIQREISDATRVRSVHNLTQLLQAAASQTARLFNLNQLAAPFQLSYPTIANYIQRLRQLYLIDLQPSWHTNLLKRLVKTPKLHFNDTGLAATLMNLNANDLTNNKSLFGQLLETFVFQELRKQVSAFPDSIQFFHHRDKDGVEVDIILEQSSASIAGIEVKASASLRERDFRGLRKLANALGERFRCGVVLYDGENTVPFGEKLYGVPVRKLWD